MKEISTQYRSFDVSRVLDSDSGLQLLRTPSARFVIPFLYTQFRVNNISSISSDDLESSLVSFLMQHREEEKVLQEDLRNVELYEEDIGSLDKDSGGFGETRSFLKDNLDFQVRAKKYVTLWCSDEKAILRRYYNRQNIAVVELTPSIERLLTFLEEIEPKKFVGTESRFKTILFQLRELNQNINEDPETRIASLKKQKKLIDDEIKKIQETGIVKTFNEVQIQERVEEIVRNSKSLLGEFRQVEENFRNILQEIYKRQSEIEATKGTILGYTLDTDAKMRESPQGQSFSSFWNFIAQDSDNEIANLARGISQEVQNDSTDFLLYLKRNLYNSGKKIVEQNRTLTERLNRILKQENANERLQIKALISEIKSFVHTYSEKICDEKKLFTEKIMSVEAKPELAFPQARKPEPPEKNSEFNEIKPFEKDATDIRDLSELFTQFYIDEKKLYEYISKYKKNHSPTQFTLKDLVQDFPIKKGLSELVAWFGIANKEKYITIEAEKTDEITYQKDGRIITVKVPRMVFL